MRRSAPLTRTPASTITIAITSAFVLASACSSSGSGSTPDDGSAPTDSGTSETAPPSDAPSDTPGGETADSGPIVTHPTNMLNDGDFETGLMCWGNWVWSKTGKDYTGDYDFFLSKDAHGGSWSAQIKCGGSDCGWPAKAALRTQAFHTPRSKPYKLTLFTKCGAGEQAFVYVPTSSTGELTKNLTCSGDWVSNEVDFTSSATDDLASFAIYYAGVTSFLVDDVVLTYADGTVPVHTVKHAGVRDVSVSDTTVSVDGKPYLALGYYDVPYDKLADAQKTGANTVAFGNEALSDCFNDDRGVYADAAYELGVNVLPDSTTTARLDEPTVYPAVMDRFAPHLANIAWYLVDEPDMPEVPWYLIQPATLVAEHDAARTKTKLPLLADFQHASYDVASHDQPYAGAVEIYAAEPYGDDITRIDHVGSVFSSMPKKPTWLAQDAASANVIVPKTWYAMVSGVTGILYFTWADVSGDAAKLAAAKQVFGEISSLHDALFGTDVTSTVTSPSGVKAMARKLGTKTYVFAVNPTTSPITGDLAISGISAGKTITVQFESRTLTSAAGKITDTFAGPSRHVYVFE